MSNSIFAFIERNVIALMLRESNIEEYDVSFGFTNCKKFLFFVLCVCESVCRSVGQWRRWP